MQIVIDIPEEVKNRLCFGVTYAKDIQTVCEALHNGTVVNDDEWMKKADNIAKFHKRDALNEVKTEIIKRFEGCYLDGTLDEWAQGEHYAYMKVLEIIDKHLRGNSDADNERRVSGDSTGDGSNGSSNRHA